MQEHILPCDSDASIQRINDYQKMLMEDPKGKAEGIFVDIDGTLLIPDEGPVRGRYHLSYQLYNVLVELSKHEKVTLFTGGDVKKQSELLNEALTLYAEHGRIKKEDINRFSIVSKEDCRGCVFTGFIIDDVAPEKQGFILQDAPNHYLKAEECYLYEVERQIKKGKSWDEALKETCLLSYYQQKNAHLFHNELHRGILWQLSKTAAKIHKLKYPSLSERLKGEVQIDTEAAVREIEEEYRKEHPKQSKTVKHGRE